MNGTIERSRADEEDSETHVEIQQPIVLDIEMEGALTTWDAVHFLSAEPKLVVAFLGLGTLTLVGRLSRQLFTFLGSCLLAVIAISIFEFSDSLPTILIIGFAAASALVSVAGTHQRRQLANLRRELTWLSHSQTRLEMAESRRVLTEMRSTPSACSRSAVVDNVEAGQTFGVLSDEPPGAATKFGGEPLGGAQAHPADQGADRGIRLGPSRTA